MFPVSGKFTTIFAGSSPQNRVARSFRQLRRFPHFINADKVFGTHRADPEREVVGIYLSVAPRMIRDVAVMNSDLFQNAVNAAIVD